MAMNNDYYDLVRNYVLNKGMDQIDADDIATTLSVFIPMYYQLPDEQPIVTRSDNSHVVSNISKLHGGNAYKRIIPPDLGIRMIMVDSYSDLPTATTYGQLYYVRHADVWLETKPNGVTEITPKLMLIHINEPLTTDPAMLKQLQEKGAEHNMVFDSYSREVDHPDNVIGLAKMRALFAENGEAVTKAIKELQRAEDQSSWSKPTGKIKFRTRHASNITRMRNNKRRG